MSGADPLALFREWQEQASAAGTPVPEAMTLATADEAGRPSARTVLLKGVDERGFVFFTNYESRKGLQLAANPYAALSFLWHTEPRRQVLVTGTVERVPRSESETYFRTRDVGSRLGAWASRQSTPIAGHADLNRAFAEAEERFGDDVPLPDWWGGYVLRPETIEFWESRPNRLHERIRYSRGEDGSWAAELLSP
ncbi:MAG TPA: pyridoxamine 5'-phosphate oxidase [Gaiellaceae bacterium]|jgi:pyridoxamine 5'-phosphate oxidase|nr:pyridoxamine 5'-phosphate oxidase [Gaiellaceae bacterium]